MPYGRKADTSRHVVVHLYRKGAAAYRLAGEWCGQGINKGLSCLEPDAQSAPATAGTPDRDPFLEQDVPGVFVAGNNAWVGKAECFWAKVRSRSVRHQYLSKGAEHDRHFTRAYFF